MSEETKKPPVEPKKKSEWSHEPDDQVINESPHFTVYLDKQFEVWGKTTAAWDKTHPRDKCKFNEVMNYEAAVESIPHKHQDDEVKRSFMKMIGSGVARALLDDYPSGKAMMELAGRYITSRNVEQARIWQIKVVFLSAVLLAICLIFAMPYPVWSGTFQSGGLHDMLLAGVAGGFGAVFSIFCKMGNSYPSSESPRLLHELETCSRIFVGVTSGCFVMAAIRSDLLFPVLNKHGSSSLVLYLLAFVSGVSEKLVPTFVAHIEDAAAREDFTTSGKRTKRLPTDAQAIPDRASEQHTDRTPAPPAGGAAGKKHKRRKAGKMKTKR